MNFYVEHLIKLEPIFEATAPTLNRNKTVTLYKTNPITTEIKGDNFQLITNKNAILYFYNSISNIISSGLYKNMFQYEIPLIRGKNLLLNFQMVGNDIGDIYYSIDVGFEGYAPLHSEIFNYKKIYCNKKCYLYLPNYYDKLNIELAQDEKVFLYYYISSEHPENQTVNITTTYYSSLINKNNHYNFLVIPENKEGEEETNLIIKFF